MLKYFGYQPWVQAIPILLLATLFFIPISASLKSIFIILSTAALLLTPTYRQELPAVMPLPWCKAAIALFISNCSGSQLLHFDVGYLFILFSALCLGELLLAL